MPLFTEVCQVQRPRSKSKNKGKKLDDTFYSAEL